MTRKKSRNGGGAKAPFARFIAGAKTEDQQLRALELASKSAVTLPAEAFVVGEPVVATD